MGRPQDIGAEGCQCRDTDHAPPQLLYAELSPLWAVIPPWDHIKEEGAMSCPTCKLTGGSHRRTRVL